ncbi:MAG: hypothetical protein MNSN_06850 [Minisyncoccus archaeiphilus]|uniref:hypothetical protein n=1 Tax=Minisyncoccus archaeiphilus TaxID=3238481 RepID=UPI002B0F1A8B|nr:MAG: hypothetical protein MNSN_06850 [Candidatus Parcubacteria bacterium]
MKTSVMVKRFAQHIFILPLVIGLSFIFIPIGLVVFVISLSVVLFLKHSISNDIMKDAEINKDLFIRIRKMVSKRVTKEDIINDLSGACDEKSVDKMIYYFRDTSMTSLTTTLIAFAILLVILMATGGAEKPVIYLYPEKETDVLVELDYQGKIIADYPDYDEEIGGWSVTAYPDGKVIDKRDGKEYEYIFWEGEFNKKVNWDLSTGFVVKGEDTREFLQNKLSLMGMTPKEYNEFIVYWYPRMKNNPYNLIHFAGKEYVDSAPLNITPKPDSVLRVFMVYKPLNHKVDIVEQEIIPFERKGFTVVEWGGTEL